MNGFIYNGKSTENIINSSELILCQFNATDTIMVSERESIRGESTLSRPVANEYGTQTTPTTFSYSLIKKDGELFTYEEQRIVERWLTSPKLSSDCQIIEYENCKNKTYSSWVYNGKFTSTEWHVGLSGFLGVTFVFDATYPYPKIRHTKTMTVNGTSVFELNCDSDELDEYVYPTVKFTSSSASTFTIKNRTDNGNSMSIKTRSGLPITIDCQHYRIFDGTTSQLITFSDLGWSDVGSIYWLRLLPTANAIEVNGNGTLEISYDSIYKRVGWL